MDKKMLYAVHGLIPSPSSSAERGLIDMYARGCRPNPSDSMFVPKKILKKIVKEKGKIITILVIIMAFCFGKADAYRPVQ